MSWWIISFPSTDINEHAVKFLVGIDDALDLFAEHAVGGILGLLFNALFADTEVIALDGVNLGVAGGWIDHNWKQLYIQFAYICATCAYTFVMTALLAKGIDIIPGLKLRNNAKGEELGMDEVEVRCLLNSHRQSDLLVFRLESLRPTTLRPAATTYHGTRLNRLRILKRKWINTSSMSQQGTVTVVLTSMEYSPTGMVVYPR